MSNPYNLDIPVQQYPAFETPPAEGEDHLEVTPTDINKIVSAHNELQKYAAPLWVADFDGMWCRYPDGDGVPVFYYRHADATDTEAGETTPGTDTSVWLPDPILAAVTSANTKATTAGTNAALAGDAAASAAQAAATAGTNAATALAGLTTAATARALLQTNIDTLQGEVDALELILAADDTDFDTAQERLTELKRLAGLIGGLGIAQIDGLQPALDTLTGAASTAQAAIDNLDIAGVDQLTEALSDTQGATRVIGSDTAAFTTAITAAHVAGHGVVQVPAGVYSVAGLQVPSDTRFILEPESIIRHTGVIDDGSVFELKSTDIGTASVDVSGLITGQTLTDGDWIGLSHAGGIAPSQNSLLSTDLASTGETTVAIDDTASTGWPSSGHLWIDDELVGYSSYATGAFTISERGAFGTVAAAHTTGAVVGASQRLWGHVMENTIHPKPYKAVAVTPINVGVSNVTFEGAGVIDGNRRAMVDDLPNAYAVECIGTSNINIGVSTYDTEHGAVYIRGSYKVKVSSPRISRSMGRGTGGGGGVIIFGSCRECSVEGVTFQGPSGNQAVFIDDRTSTLIEDGFPPIGTIITRCDFQTDFGEVFDAEATTVGECIAVGPSVNAFITNNRFTPFNSGSNDYDIRCVSVKTSGQGVSSFPDHGKPDRIVVEENQFLAGHFGVFSGVNAGNVVVGKNVYADGVGRATTAVVIDSDLSYSVPKVTTVGTSITVNNEPGWTTYMELSTTKIGVHQFNADTFYTATTIADVELRINGDGDVLDLIFVAEGATVGDNASPNTAEVRRTVAADADAIPFAGGDAVAMSSRMAGTFTSDGSGATLVFQYRQRNTEASDAVVLAGTYGTLTRV